MILVINHLNFNFNIFNNSLYSNFFFISSKLLLLIFYFLFLFLNFSYFYVKKIVSYEFLLIISFSIFGMILVINSNDFLILYLALELQSLCFYILASFKRRSFYSAEAGLKYFILGSLSSGFLLFSISIIFGCTGIINFIDLEFFFFNFNFNFFLYCSDFLFLSLFFFFSGIFFKLSLAPFHNWTLDVFEGSSIVITCFFTLIAKIPIFFLIIKFIYIIFFSIFFSLQFFVIFCALFSIILGSIGALEQTNIKRLFGYITIFSAGYLVLGLSVNNCNGVFSAIFYLISTTILIFNFFSVILGYFSFNYSMLRDLKDLSIFFKSNIIISIFFLFLFFSFAGLPPFLGFFSKFFLLYSLIQNGLFFITIILIIFSLLNFYIFIKLIKYLFFLQQDRFYFYFDFNFATALLFSIASLLNLLFFVTPNFFLNLCLLLSLYINL